MQETNIVDITPFLAKHQLPLKYQYLSEQYFVPLAEDILHSKPTDGPMLVAINGCQGSGKTTLADFLVTWINCNTAFNSIAISIDDFYHSHAHRQQLSKDVHPLFATRGVPGTHDTALMQQTFTALLAGKVGVPLPQFDKQTDDPVTQALWPTNKQPVDIIFFEGWCVGSIAQQPYQLHQSVNQLEQYEDPEGIWRRCVNSCLANEYQDIFAMIDYTVMLKAPSFADVYGWRLEQEQKLMSHKGRGQGTFDEQQLVRFISHFERITRENLTQLPEQVDALLSLDKVRDISAMKLRADDVAMPLIFTDLDGTLLDHNDYQCTEIAPFLSQLSRAGIAVVFNTSKTFAEVIALQKSLGLNQPFIIENGGAVYIPKNYFSLKPIGCEELDEYWRYALSPTNKQLYSELLEYGSEFSAYYRLFSQLSAQEVSQITDLSLAQSELARIREYSDPLFWQGTEQQLLDFLEAIKPLGYEVLIGGRFIHLNRSTNKGKAQNWLVEQFKKHCRHAFTTIALGDSQNDMAMLDAADIAILINNPASKAKAKLSHKPWRVSEHPAPQGWLDEVADLSVIKAQLASKQEQSHG